MLHIRKEKMSECVLDRHEVRSGLTFWKKRSDRERRRYQFNAHFWRPSIAAVCRYDGSAGSASRGQYAR